VEAGKWDWGGERNQEGFKEGVLRGFGSAPCRFPSIVFLAMNWEDRLPLLKAIAAPSCTPLIQKKTPASRSQRVSFRFPILN
jgi:hypothetical protein